MAMSEEFLQVHKRHINKALNFLHINEPEAANGGLVFLMLLSLSEDELQAMIDGSKDQILVLQDRFERLGIPGDV